MDKLNFIFCNHPLYQRQVDMDYEEEYNCAKSNHSCALFSYEDLEKGKLSLYKDEITGLTIYRGWMMKPKMYELFYNMLKEKGIILINNPSEYERYHMLPNWYEDFKNDTIYSVWEDKGNIESAMSLTNNLDGAYIVKDYVKSRKHEWYDACFIKDISDKNDCMRVVSNFIKGQSDALVGGLVLRKYENLKSIGYHERSKMPISEEYRVFIYNGKILIIGDYWQEDKINLSKEEYNWIDEIAKKVKSNFVTMDIARREDGQLIIMEFGDGQVSGLQQIKEEVFYKKIEENI